MVALIRTATTRTLAAATLLAVGSSLSATGAFAQTASSCGELQTHLMQRKSIADRLQGGGKKQVDAKVACTSFTQLVQNGTVLVKWTDANKDWCQIPESFIESIKADHVKAQAIRTKACGVAAKQIQMEKQAKSGGGAGGGGGLLGGGGLSGANQLPQGAL